jgi:hypothetical protein
MEKYLFTIQNVETGKLNALVNNIMKQTGADDPNEAIRLVNSGEWTITGPVRSWRETDGVIYFSVTSYGTTGKKWIARLEKKGFRVSDYAKNLLLKDFQPTNGVTTEIAVLKGTFFSDSDRMTKNIRAEGEHRTWVNPNPEVACLIREKFSDKELEDMGLYWIVVMHEPIKDSDGAPKLLRSSRSGDGRWLGTCYGKPGNGFNRGDGFAFEVSRKKMNANDLMLIDCDAAPFIPDGWSVEEHKKGGFLKFDPTKISLCLSKKQKKGSIEGNDLRKELINQPTLNANVLDYLLAHPELIPEEWKGKYIFFWGTIYRDSGGRLTVRCLYWGGSGWNEVYYWLDDGFSSDDPAAIAS